MSWLESFQWAFTSITVFISVVSIYRVILILRQFYPLLFWSLVALPVLVCLFKLFTL